MFQYLMALSDPIIGGLSVIDLLIFLLYAAIAVLISRVVYIIIRRYLDPKVSKKTSKSIARMVNYAMIALALYIGFVVLLKQDLSSLFVSLGILGLAGALAAQQVLQNAFAGMMIAIAKPYELEDWVEVGIMPMARVRDISLMFTEMRDVDGKIISIPNSFVLSNRVINYTQGGFVALTIPILFQPGTDLNKVGVIVLDVADVDEDILPRLRGEEKRALDRILVMPKMKAIFGDQVDTRLFDPQVNITGLGLTRMNVNLRIWVKDPHRREVIISNFLKVLRVRFKAEGIELADS
jgi:small conductance mechanosensitive channel